MNRVFLSPEYFPSPTIGRPISGAQIFVGIVDLDPEIEANRKQISLQQEDGSIVDVSQPVVCGAGGVPLHIGSPVTILVSGDYALKVLDSGGSQVYYIPKIEGFPSGQNLDDMLDLVNAVGQGDGDVANIAGYFSSPPQSEFSGGGSFTWQAGVNKNTANGGTIIDPDNTGGFDGTASTRDAFLTAQGGGSGSGCWIRTDTHSYNVDWFGTINDGATDDSLAFQVASDTLVGIDYQLSKSSVLKAKVKTINVDGSYSLSSNITSPDKIVWILSAQTDIDETKLTGQVFIDGIHVNAIHTGILENATSLSVRAGVPLDEVGGVYGILSEDEISRVGPPHSVTLQVANGTKIIPISLTGTEYTSTSVVYTNNVDLSDVKTGASITSQGSQTHTAIITAVNESLKTITVSGGWRPFTGVNGSTGTPTNGDTAIIDYFAKIWGQNTNVTLASGHPTELAAGYELGVLNQQQDAEPLDPTVTEKPIMWGFDAVNLGAFKSTVAHLARAGGAAWRTGFASFGSEIGFQVIEKTSFPNIKAFEATIENGFFLQCTTGGEESFSVFNTGVAAFGRKDAAQVTTLDLHSSGNDNDYDVRLQATLGSATKGEGIFTIRAGFVQVDSILRPETDDLIDLGGASFRWKDIYAGNDVIQTSDEREKQDIESLDDTERKVATALKGMIKKFRFKSSVEDKGDDARIHVGVMAQEVAAVFEAEGLDAARYGILCYDEWEEQQEIKDDNGVVTQPFIAAGNRYGIRYNELLCFIISAM